MKIFGNETPASSGVFPDVSYLPQWDASAEAAEWDAGRSGRPPKVVGIMISPPPSSEMATKLAQLFTEQGRADGQELSSYAGSIDVSRIAAAKEFRPLEGRENGASYLLEFTRLCLLGTQELHAGVLRLLGTQPAGYARGPGGTLATRPRGHAVTRIRTLPTWPRKLDAKLQGFGRGTRLNFPTFPQAPFPRGAPRIAELHAAMLHAYCLTTRTV